MLIRDALRCELAKRDFWEYCKLRAPDFYTEDREYLKNKCCIYQEFYESPAEHYLIDNEPPRHGKSRTAQLFVEWVLGKYPKDKIVGASYNELLSRTFSKFIRNDIQEESGDGRIVYHDIFPDTQIRRGDSAARLWGLVGNSTESYLATSPDGSLTGFGADLILIDDIIKNEYEARNENVKEQHWKWYTDTMTSRKEGKRKVIVIMTRWATEDLAGRLMETLDSKGRQYRKISYQAFDGQKMLCDGILNHEEYQEILDSDISPEIIEANYNQQPIDVEGRLYTGFKTYDELPEGFEYIACYTDTADTGTDYLCAIIYGVKNYQAYVLDIIYTQEKMEYTEEVLALKLTKHEANRVFVESNNGGRGFARNVMRLVKTKYENEAMIFKWFYQNKNKEARILTGASGVMANILFPAGWEQIWPEYHKAMVKYQRTGKNAHDDAPDATTGVYEFLPKKPLRKRERPPINF